jgi:NAD(P)-dependent dehydrogenase (short-subunit alcohol dehydrogenase family)
MALVVEDGSQVTGANSYISLVNARAFATSRGKTLSVVDATAEAALIKAMDVIESYRARFQGTKVSKDQALQWPRTGVEVDGFPLDDDEIPVCLPQAQAALAIEAQTTELFSNSDGRQIVRERVEGAVDIQYSESGSKSPQPSFGLAEALLAPLFAGSSGSTTEASLFLRTVRV